MILEHEIPHGTRLYFGDAAKVKRKIESIASDVLYTNGFEEIVTPVFSYHQHLSIADERELVKVNDTKNNSLTLRADSTIDVVRIIEKRLGENTEHKKWFYIQPVFRYPTEEHYQVGVEFMGEKKLSSVLNIAVDILGKLKLKPLIQISDMRIPIILTELFDTLTLEDFRHLNIEKFLNLKIEWLTKLVYLQHVEQLDELLDIAPQEIQKELLKMKNVSQEMTSANIVLAPLYYAEMLYYKELFFRIIDKNEVYAKGGRYTNNEVSSVGFAIYTDTVCETLTK